MNRSLLLIAVIGVALPVRAGNPNQTFRVAIEARDASSAIFASPTAIVRPDATWNMRVDGAEGYELSMQVSESSVDGHVKACGTFNSKKGNIAPCLDLVIGEQGIVKAGDVSIAITVSQGGT